MRLLVTRPETEGAALEAALAARGHTALRDPLLAIRIDPHASPSLDGVAGSVVVPREAMGMGDIHLLGMIGAFFGWAGVFFSLFAASLYAIVAAVIGRVGFGRQLPFGPFLALGCLSWAIGGWQIWKWYFDFIGPLWGP